jgi:type IV secretory pathway TraG/TraD family ATPase VirD4
VQGAVVNIVGSLDFGRLAIAAFNMRPQTFSGIYAIPKPALFLLDEAARLGYMRIIADTAIEIRGPGKT